MMRKKREAEVVAVPSSDEAANTKVPESDEEWVFMVGSEDVGGDRQIARQIISTVEEKVVKIMLDSGAVTTIKAEHAYNWTTATNPYPTEVVGDYAAVSKAMRAKYSHFFASCE